MISATPVDATGGVGVNAAETGTDAGLVAVQPAQTITAKNDALRTGWYGNQSGLDPAIVGGPTFGRIFKTQLPLANPEVVLAQPLVSGNALFVATEANNLYSLDAVSGTINASRSLGAPWVGADIGCGDLETVGVTGTPVIDPATNTAYFFSKSYKNATSTAVWFAHAVDVATLAERPGFPIEVAGTAANDPSITFDPFSQMQRTGLLLMDGVVYAGFGAHCDKGEFHGYVVGIGLLGGLKTIFATEAGPDGVRGAGIWQAGGGLVSDGPGRIFFMTSNGYSNSMVDPLPGRMPPGALDESFVHTQVQADGTLQAVDFFAPYNATDLDNGDRDFGSGGPMGLPDAFGTVAHPHLAVAGGKAATVYLVDRDALGGFKEGPNQGDSVVSQVTLPAGMWSGPAFWPGDGGWVYLTVNGDPMQALSYGLRDDGVPALTAVGQTADTYGYTSGSPIVTSNGTASGSALVWVTSTPAAWGAGAIHAYSAVPDNTGTLPLVFEDAYGLSSKFAVPGVGDGRIYIGTSDGFVIGYGTPKTTPISGGPVDFGTVVTGQSVTRQIVLTADQATQLATVQSANAAFTVGAPTPGLPLTMATGDNVTVPVTFAPTSAQEYVAALDVVTGNGPAAVSMKGLGQAVGPNLTVKPTSVSFGGLASGTMKTTNVILTNTGAGPVTFATVTQPAAPFTVTGAPLVGTTLASGASQTVTITFAPPAAGTFADSLQIGANGHTATIYISGTSASSGNLVVAPVALDYGSVATGTATSLTFAMQNTGGVALTITKSKPPSLGTFVAKTTLSEGTMIPSGDTVYETVSFAPQSEGAFNDQWIITGSDGGAQAVNFHGLAGKGTGVSGTYFDTMTLTGNTVQRIDPNIAFDWGDAPPADNVPPPHYSVRWTGQVEAVFTELYTFTTTSDDGIRLWVNDTLLVDHWTDHGTEIDERTINLIAGQKYDLKVEYYNDIGAAVAKLQWSSPSTPITYVPTAFLFPTGYTGP